MKRIGLKIAVALVLVLGTLGIGNTIGAITIHAAPAATSYGPKAVPVWAQVVRPATNSATAGPVH